MNKFISKLGPALIRILSTVIPIRNIFHSEHTMFNLFNITISNNSPRVIRTFLLTLKSGSNSNMHPPNSHSTINTPLPSSTSTSTSKHRHFHSINNTSLSSR
jgi:hypothetical protein